MVRSYIIAAAVLTVATPALAGPRTDATPFLWSGYYVGAQAGYSWGDVDSHDESKFSGDSDWRDSWSTAGAIGGIHAGYNYVSNSVLYGIEADLEASNVSGSVDSEYAGVIETSINVQGSLRGRIGYIAGPALFYATGGLAVADVKSTYNDVNDFTVHDSSSNVQAGWTIGGGIEYAWSPRWTTRVEYRYTDLGRFTDNPRTDSGYNYPTDVTLQAIRFGTSYKF